MAEDLQKKLADNARRRADLTAEVTSAEKEEHELIAQAWREHMPPAEIADLTQRSAAHVRKLRPDDVPPLRKGGGAAPRKRAKRKTPPA